MIMSWDDERDDTTVRRGKAGRTMCYSVFLWLFSRFVAGSAIWGVRAEYGKGWQLGMYSGVLYASVVCLRVLR
jgi:hypothetical protein